MKKNAVSIVLSLALMFGIQNSTHAAEKLTYDAALKMAYANNLTLERTKDSADKIDDTLTTGISGMFPEVDPQMASEYMAASIVNSKSTAYNDLINNQQLTKQSIDVQKEAIGLGLKNSFITIENLEKNATLLDKKIANMRNTLNVNIIKYKIGMISKMDFDKANLDYEELLSEKNENVLKLKMAYSDLENLLGTKNEKKISYVDLAYTPLSKLNLSLNSQIGQAVAEAPSIIAQNNQIYLLEQKIKYNLLDELQTSLPSQESKIDVKIKNTELRLSKNDVKTAVISTENRLQNMEAQIENLEVQKKNLEQSVKQLDAAVNLGLKTKMELDTVNLSLDEITQSLENLKETYQILLERYQKPYLLTLGGQAWN